MNILRGSSDFFGLDIGTTAIRVVHLAGSGNVRTLVKYAYAPVDARIVLSDARADQQKVAQAVKDLLGQARLSTKNVAVGLPSQRVFNTVVDIERLSNSELAKTIRLQADSLIPTPPEESRIDWRMIGDSPIDKTKVEVLISSVTNEYVETKLEMLESIGLNVIAFEPESLALCRSMLAPESVQPQIVMDIGSRSTDLVIAVNGAPRLTRNIPVGTDAIVHSAMQNLNIDDKQAEQFVFKFGLSKDKLDGQIYQAIIGTVDVLVNELEKSIKFFATRYGALRPERIIVTGGASTLPEFPLYVANKFGISVEIGNAWRNVAFPADRQNELLAVSNHFGVASGLAQRAE